MLYGFAFVFVDPEVDAMTGLFWRALFPLWKQDYERMDLLGIIAKQAIDFL